ncbi:hypothetical protein Poli38472_001018 [Pythium oligandrum]|uniref:Uncharacterized protein n=1 Tax=Pythium oligandrum TaxID=41045 RepID=A0A8K1CU45_PYTOL|nr:hypothetical protein Poli38472_001018 [Pythium oligandrum]|eukprot:TMW68862.1 hypothetical protein Poli38472_001018 [Pythium oligandrum]
MTTAVLTPATASPTVPDAAVVSATQKAGAESPSTVSEKMEEEPVVEEDMGEDGPCDDSSMAHDSESNNDDTKEQRVEQVTGSRSRLTRSQSTPLPREKQKKKRRRVSFEAADIVEFEPTVFTTSVTSGGIPVGMSLQERSRSRRRLDSWEQEREDVRVGRENYMEHGYLDPTERELILSNAGCGEQSMASVEAEVNQIILHRRESNELDYEYLYGLVSIGEEGNHELEGDEEEDDEEEEIEEVQLLNQPMEEDDTGRDESVTKTEDE